jgi:membrane protein YdbS with pleckstrin-like domain
MSYAEKLLSRGEEIVYSSRQHWFAVIARVWVWILIVIVALAVLLWIGTNTGAILDNDGIDTGATFVAVAVFVLTLAYIGFVIWDWRNQEWLITTRRVMRAEGVLNKSVTDTSLEKINDARLDQNVFGRIFGFGTLDILTAAEEFSGGGIADFPMIADPVTFKKAMFDQKHALENPDAAPPRRYQSAPPPEMQRAEPMPPRAGSDRVAVHSDDAPPLPASAEAAAVAAQPPPPPPPAEGAASRSPADELGETLERLADLRDRGLITPEEYETKKRDLLERM